MMKIKRLFGVAMSMARPMISELIPVVLATSPPNS
jgi:hypothetical protein